jgi:hypothetical protein
MRVIGLRAEARAFHWAVTEGSQEAPVLVVADFVRAPKTYDFATGANHLRARFLQIAREQRVDAVGLRTPERLRSVTESIRERFRIEGVLLAASADAALPVTQGPLATVSSNLGVKTVKTLLESSDFRGINLGTFSKEKREAILMSASLLRPEE